MDAPYVNWTLDKWCECSDSYDSDSDDTQMRSLFASLNDQSACLKQLRVQLMSALSASNAILRAEPKRNPVHRTLLAVGCLNITLPRIFSSETVTSKRAAIAQLVKRIITGWTIQGSHTGGEEIFRTRPDRPWDPPSVLYNAYPIISGGKAAGTWR